MDEDDQKKMTQKRTQMINIIGTRKDGKEMRWDEMKDAYGEEWWRWSRHLEGGKLQDKWRKSHNLKCSHTQDKTQNI